jgi:hypothetical protein
MAALFDLSDEIQLIDQAPDHYGVEVEDFFYAVRTCGMIAVIIPVFEAEKTEKGMVISAYGSICLHEIQIRENRVLLGSQAIDDKDTRTIQHFFVGPSDNPASWQGVVRHIFKAERAILQMVDFTGRLRSEWDEYLRIRRDRLGF